MPVNPSPKVITGWVVEDQAGNNVGRKTLYTSQSPATACANDYYSYIRDSKQKAETAYFVKKVTFDLSKAEVVKVIGNPNGKQEDDDDEI
ncbi:hypothetical protein [Ralstonia phage RSP15]|uniref:hypothetical protein n=1 Tax=Ralstonia phage RSP15 TaxID=1785960 RepID=UPI00074D3399|nr:hypothetical protein BH754_gp212 [Ralstonia phage RSP15]BAU40094.1 hypothetical protein [Ralstonia phage RSP15]